MGVKHFYYWYSRQYKNCIGTTKPYPVDILGIDMNGIFHGCAQKVYRYGNFANTIPVSHLSHSSVLRGNIRQPLPVKITPLMHEQFKVRLFQEVCQRVQDIVKDIEPTTTLLLCVDGVAGLGKMNQQRQRRFRTSQERNEKEQSDGFVASNIPPFNSNQFTPGTVLMDHLTKYLDGFVRKKQSTDELWKRLRVVLSNEKAPGEGEHKIMHYIRQYASSKDRVCIFGMDGDLVMLAMLLPTKNVLIARETDYYRHEYIVVSDFIEKVLQELDWETETHPYSGTDEPIPPNTKTMKFHPQRAIQDFVLLCFLVGNDFLPTLPALSIMDGGLHLMFETYRKNGSRYGHLTQISDNQIHFCQRSMGMFFGLLAKSEQKVLQGKYNSGATFHHDPIIIKNATGNLGSLVIDLDGVRKEFYEKKFPSGESMENVCHRYFDGMMWVANYYRTGIPDWLWHFPYLYAPFLQDIAVYWKTYRPTVFRKHHPVDPFLQLIMVLPPSDQKELVPKVLQFMDQPHLKAFFPDKIVIDLSGKKKEWEGIVNIPMIPYSEFLTLYNQRKPFIPPQDAKRNIRGKTFIYSTTPQNTTPYTFKSYYMSIPHCTSSIEAIVLPH